MSIKVALRLVMIILLSIFDDDSSFTAHFQSLSLCDMSSLLLMMKSGTTTKKKEAHDMSARLRVSESLCRGEFMIFMECHRYF